MSKLRVTFGEGTSTGLRSGGTRQTYDISADVVVSTVGGFLNFRDRHGAIVLIVPEACTYRAERIEEDDA